MLKITDKYYLETDRYNWVLWERHIVTKDEAKKNKRQVAGQAIYRNPTYHATLENTLKFLIEKRQKDIANMCEDINKLVTEVKHANDDIYTKIKKLAKEIAQM